MKEIKICLDAGHYGKYNMSPANSRYYESEVMWKLHLLLKKYLQIAGFTVIQTRNNLQEDKSLAARGKYSKDCDLLLSLHSNAAGTGKNDSVDYPLAIVPIDGSADDIGLLLAKCIEETIGTEQPGRILKKKGTSGDYYGVIRGANSVGTPGIILEHSFHTNTIITNWLLNNKNLDKLAKAEADVLTNYYGINKAIKVDKAKSKNTAIAGTYRVKSSDGLKLRSGASTSHHILEDMPNNSLVKCYGYYTDNWYYVVSPKGSVGFCHKSYLSKIS